MAVMIWPNVASLGIIPGIQCNTPVLRQLKTGAIDECISRESIYRPSENALPLKSLPVEPADGAPKE